MENELIVVKQLPIIEEQLQMVKQQFQDESEYVLSLEVNEETYREVKRARTDITKIFNELEVKRKAVKKAILAPYDQFEQIYKDCVTNIYAPTKAKLDSQITQVENELKAQKEEKVVSFFEEYKASKNVDFISFTDLQISITQTASLKSLREKVAAFIDNVVGDLELIATQNHSTEILVEYKKTLNVSQAIVTVTNRLKAIEEEQQRVIQQQELQRQQQEALSKIDEILDEEEFIAPVIIEEEAVEEVAEEPTEELAQEEKVLFRTPPFVLKSYSMDALKEAIKYLKEREDIEYEQC